MLLLSESEWRRKRKRFRSLIWRMSRYIVVMRRSVLKVWKGQGGTRIFVWKFEERRRVGQINGNGSQATKTEHLYKLPNDFLAWTSAALLLNILLSCPKKFKFLPKCRWFPHHTMFRTTFCPCCVDVAPCGIHVWKIHTWIGTTRHWKPDTNFNHYKSG